MKPRAFNFVAAGSLALFVVIAVIWARSYASETILLESRHGQCVLIGIDCNREAVRKARDGAGTLEDFVAQLTARPTVFSIGSTGLPPTPAKKHQGMGFLLVRGDWCTIADPTAANSLWQPPFWILGIPYWFLALLAAVMPVSWLRIHRRVAHRHLHGLCSVCGYDLRATHDRCPECGTPAAQGIQP